MFFVLFFLVLLFPRADCHFFLLKELEAPPGSLTLAQLGHLSCSDPGTQKAYKTIAEKMRLATIFPSSPPILWNRGYLLKKWEQFHREKPILIAGAQEIQIRPSAVTVSRDEFRALVEEEILKSLPQDLDYKIQIRDFPSKIDLPGDQYRIEFLTDRISRGHLRVKFFHEDRLLKQFFLNFKVLTRQGVFKTTTPLMRGESLDPKRLRIEEEFISIQERPLSTSKFLEIPEMKVKRNLPAGTIVKARDVEFKTIVKIRQRLKGILKNGSLRIDMQVISLRNGKKGDSIEVQSLDTKKKFQAIVIDSRTVKLIL